MEKSCTLLVHLYKGKPALANEIKEALEGNDDVTKIDAIKKAIMLLLNGHTIPQLFIAIIRYVLPSENYIVQKLLLFYLEIIDKTDSKGKVLPEMILICQYLQKNLQHPNEYIRGVTLRFLCRLNETEIIEPLIPSIISNLEHRHPFVRRNAVLAAMSLYKLPKGEHLLYSALEMIDKLWSTEHDNSTKRSAFLVLVTCAQDRAVNYLSTHIDKINDWGEQLQMVVLELIRKVCRTNKGEKGKYIKIVISLMNAPSTVVIYECAGTLVSLSSTPTAIRAATTSYCRLLLSQSDNNVKLMVLRRLKQLKASSRDIMVEMVVDVLGWLSSPNPDIKRKAVDIALELITLRNIDEVVMMLTKEVVKTQNGDHEKYGEYRTILAHTIHSCAIKFPEVASSAVHLLMDFLGDTDVESTIDVVLYVREIIEINPKLRVSIVARFLDTFNQIRAEFVTFYALWIIGEYCLSLAEVESGIATIKQCLGDPPFLKDASKITPLTNLRSSILSGYLQLGPVIAQTLTKLILRLEEVQTSKVEVNKATRHALLIMVAILQLGQSLTFAYPLDNDCHDRIVICIRLLCNTGGVVKETLLQSWRQSFVKMFSDKQCREKEEIKAKAHISNSQPDDIIDVHYLKRRKLDVEDEVQDDLKCATREFTKDVYNANKLNRILQLTGCSDPVYVEAVVTINHVDIVIDVTVINRTKKTLQNLCLELATKGGLVLVERPQNYILAPKSRKQMKANIKVSSTKTGVICGYIVYETSSNVLERTIIVLNDIPIDITLCISPSPCSDNAFYAMFCSDDAFYAMWKQSGPSCEYKVDVNTVMQDEREFLNHIQQCSNMKCVISPSALEEACGFLVANLYAKSIFGHDVLMNICIGKQSDDKLTGHIKIRTKDKEIGVSLERKIRLKLKIGF